MEDVVSFCYASESEGISASSHPKRFVPVELCIYPEAPIHDRDIEAWTHDYDLQFASDRDQV